MTRTDATPSTISAITAGDRVYSFDFPANASTRIVDGPEACFTEGIVVRVLRRGETMEITPRTGPKAGEVVPVTFQNCDRYAIRTIGAKFNGKPVDALEWVFPPVNGIRKWTGDVTNGVELA